MTNIHDSDYSLASNAFATLSPLTFLILFRTFSTCFLCYREDMTFIRSSSRLNEFRSRSEALCHSTESQSSGRNHKKTSMKKYPNLYELEKLQKLQQQLDELLFFQMMLRTSDQLNEQYCGRAKEIALGLQPWIDALKCRIQG